MFCGKCGKQIKEGNSFCTGCGERIECEPIPDNGQLPWNVETPPDSSFYEFYLPLVAVRTDEENLVGDFHFLKTEETQYMLLDLFDLKGNYLRRHEENIKSPFISFQVNEKYYLAPMRFGIKVFLNENEYQELVKYIDSK